MFMLLCNIFNLVSPCDNISMSSKSINDLPNEVIEKSLLKYLSSKDVKSFGMVGNRRLKGVANSALKRRRKLICHNIENYLIFLNYILFYQAGYSVTHSTFFFRYQHTDIGWMYQERSDNQFWNYNNRINHRFYPVKLSAN